MDIDEMRANPARAAEIIKASRVSERNKSMALRVANGETYSSVGIAFEVSHQRVRNIVEACIADGMKAENSNFETAGRDTHVSDCALPTRVTNCLINARIFTVGELKDAVAERGTFFLTEEYNFGEKSRRIVLEFLGMEDMDARKRLEKYEKRAAQLRAELDG